MTEDLYLPPEQDVVELNVVVVCVGFIRLVQSSLHPADELVLVLDIHPCYPDIPIYLQLWPRTPAH